MDPVMCYWHFLPDDGCLQFGEPRKKVVVGRTLRIKEQPVLCERGFHASRKAIDALQYAPGSLVCRVTLGGEIVEDSGKLAAQERTVIWKADATNVLHEFACWCAEQALRAAKVDDARSWAAIETKRKWLRGEATDDELAAVRAAAWAAAWAARDAVRAAAWAARDAVRAAAWAAAWAARDAVRDAAWDAAWDAARAAAWAAAQDAWAAVRAAAWDAARAAAWAAAWAAAQDAWAAAQNDKFTEMLLALEPKRKKRERTARA